MPGDQKKKYGLILASARKAEARGGGRQGIRSLNPLRDSDEELEKGEESGEEQTDSMDWVQATLKKSGGGNSAQLAQQQRLMREALQEDPSVFQYDEHYDTIKSDRETSKQQKTTLNKQPKYIHNILKAADRRKIEKERRAERKVQAEREAEKGLYEGKESFVTSSYLKKLEELKEAEQEEKYQQMIEDKTDVAKHKNMGVFYEHIFKQRLGDGDQPPSASKEDESAKVEMKKINEKNKSNKYRQIESSQSPLREIKTEVDENIDADTDVEIDTDSESHDGKSKKRRKRSSSSSSSASSSSDEESLKRKSKSQKSKKSIKDADGAKIKKEKEDSSSEREGHKENSPSPEKKPVVKETREERIEKLFRKRTVGDKFLEAQQRYFQRKAARLEMTAA